MTLGDSCGLCHAESVSPVDAGDLGRESRKPCANESPL